MTLGKLQEKLTQEGITCQGTSKSLFVEKDGNEYTILEDGTIIEGKVAYLDIADGSIQLKNNGYVQGTESLVEFNGKYIITGKTTENTVSVIEKGTYNITLKELDIEVTSGNVSAFDANKNYIQTECFVNITLEGNNRLICGVGATGLQFSGSDTNINGKTDGSTLTIQGEGNLQATGGCGIGGAIRTLVGNITIN